MSQTTVLFAGGGTGGHIFPGVAIAEHLVGDGVNARSICSQRPGDAAMLAALGTPFVAIPAQPFGLRPRTLLRFMRHWGTCVRTVRGLIREHRRNGPVVMVALGGFVAAPAAQAARAERCPILLVNLDAVPGRANRWIARFATRTVTAAQVPGLTWEYIQPIVRASAKAPGDAASCRVRLGLDPDRPTLMITGASLGARTINEFMMAFVNSHAAVLRDGRWQIFHQTGQGGDAAVRAAYEAASIKAVVVPFSDAMGAAWGAADCAVSRCGAGSVAEAWCNQVPTLFLPYPHHKDQHQRLNALPLVERHAAMLGTDEVDPQRTLSNAGPMLLQLLTDASFRTAVRNRLVELGTPSGASTAASAILTLARSASVFGGGLGSRSATG